MSLTELEKRIDGVLDRGRARATSQHAEIMQAMVLETEAEQRFERRAQGLFDTLIEPRLKVLAGRTPASEYGRAGRKPEGVVRANLDRRVSASIELSVQVRWISGSEASIVCSRTVLPILIEFAREVALTVDIASVSEDEVTRFVEDGIIDFLELVARVEADPRYRQSSTEIDPVCGMSIHRADAAGSATYAGETYYFCVAACRDRFLAAPEQHVRSSARRALHPADGPKAS